RLAISCVMSLALCPAAWPGDPKSVSHAFKVTLVSRLDLENAGKKQKVTVDSEFQYTWTHKGRERVLTFDQITLKATLDGVDQGNAIMTRDKIINISGEKKE